MLDTGADIVQLSVDHRVATHRQERRRLEGTGALVAPIDVSGGAPVLCNKHTGRRLLSSCTPDGYVHPRVSPTAHLHKLLAGPSCSMNTVDLHLHDRRTAAGKRLHLRSANCLKLTGG